MTSRTGRSSRPCRAATRWSPSPATSPRHRSVRRYYADASRLQILTLEDEVFEAEVLFASVPRRAYVRALAVCDRGSQLLAVVAPNPEARGLPMPQGTPPANLPTPVPTGG